MTGHMSFKFESVRPKGSLILFPRQWHDLWSLLLHMKFSESELPPPFMDNEQVFLPRRLAKRIAKALNDAIERNYVKKMLVDKGGRPNLVELLVFHPDYAGSSPKLSALDDEEKAWLIGIADFFDKSNGCYISRFDLHIVK